MARAGFLPQDYCMLAPGSLLNGRVSLVALPCFITAYWSRGWDKLWPQGSTPEPHLSKAWASLRDQGAVTGWTSVCLPRS